MPRKPGCLVVLVVLVAGLYLLSQHGQCEVVGRIVGGGGMSMVGAMFALIGINGARLRLENLRNGEQIRGKVVDGRSTSEGTNPIVEFEDQTGQAHRKEVSFISFGNWHMDGEIDLLLNLETGSVDPVKFDGWPFLVLSSVLGMGSFLCGIAWLVSGG